MGEVEQSGQRLGRYLRRSSEGRRDKKVKLSFTEEEWARLASLSLARGVSPALFCRQAAFAGDAVRAAELSHVRAELYVVQRLMGGAARNLNQIAKGVNSGAEVELAQVLACVEVIERQAARVVEAFEAVSGGSVVE